MDLLSVDSKTEESVSPGLMKHSYSIMIEFVALYAILHVPNWLWHRHNKGDHFNSQVNSLATRGGDHTVFVSKLCRMIHHCKVKMLLSFSSTLSTETNLWESLEEEKERKEKGHVGLNQVTVNARIRFSAHIGEGRAGLLRNCTPQNNLS